MLDVVVKKFRLWLGEEQALGSSSVQGKAWYVFNLEEIGIEKCGKIWMSRRANVQHSTFRSLVLTTGSWAYRLRHGEFLWPTCLYMLPGRAAGASPLGTPTVRTPDSEVPSTTIWMPPHIYGSNTK